jgi:short-subunit dehydrogenase
MKLKLKPINRQVVVITGATSGIGLTTARLAARQGARLMLIARNEDALEELVAELTAAGTQAEYAVADVANEAQLRAAADATITRFGGFDTWVNNAGASAYGRLEDMPINHSRIALRRLAPVGHARC